MKQWNWLRSLSEKKDLLTLNKFLSGVGERLSNVKTKSLIVHSENFDVEVEPGCAYIEKDLYVGGKITGGGVACIAFHNTTQSTTSGITLYAALNSEAVDTDGMHDNTTNNSRITCKSAGIYMISAQVSFSTNTSGARIALVRKNGSSQVLYNDIAVNSSGGSTGQVNGPVQMDVGDYIELGVFQNSGATNNVTINFFSAIKIANIQT